ncbi:MAG TPA: hypothetical protein VGI99_05860 [Gemmataceae bacterium]
MRRVVALALGAWLFASLVRGQEPVTPVGGSVVPDISVFASPSYVPYVPPLALPGVDPARLNPTVPPPPPSVPLNPFAQATEAGGQPSRTFNENFDGDPSPIYYKQTITTGFVDVPHTTFTQQVTGFTQQVSINAAGVRTVTNVPVFSNVPVTTHTLTPVHQTVSIPLAGRYNGVSVVEWGNPLPRNTAYIGYNYYANAGGALNPTIGGSNIDRQTAGFESVVFGNASIGVRLPFVQQYGPLGFGSQQVGDLTVLLKYAAYYNPETGNAITGGFAVTAPTGGGSALLADGTTAPHSWLLQPWGGFVYCFTRGYVQGISNIITPTDSRDVTLWGNSLGVGYWLYTAPSADSWLTGITPVAEVHVRTPMNHRDPNGDVFYMDQVNVTTGAHFRFNRAVISAALVVPMVGPHPFNTEAIVYGSYWF